MGLREGRDAGAPLHFKRGLLFLQSAWRSPLITIPVEFYWTEINFFVSGYEKYSHNILNKCAKAGGKTNCGGGLAVNRNVPMPISWDSGYLHAPSGRL